ncbi:MAG: HIT family protein [Nitrososphaerota archaeon]
MKGDTVVSLDDCPFCKIVRGENRAAIVYDDEDHICIMDRYPFNPGHVLVMPKRHYSTILEMPSSEVGRLFTLVAELTKVIARALKADGLNIGQNNGVAAHQLVPHVHVHIIPRYVRDAAEGHFPVRKRMSFEELERIAEIIRQESARSFSVV